MENKEKKEELDIVSKEQAIYLYSEFKDKCNRYCRSFNFDPVQALPILTSFAAQCKNNIVRQAALSDLDWPLDKLLEEIIQFSQTHKQHQFRDLIYQIISSVTGYDTGYHVVTTNMRIVDYVLNEFVHSTPNNHKSGKVLTHIAMIAPVTSDVRLRIATNHKRFVVKFIHHIVTTTTNCQKEQLQTNAVSDIEMAISLASYLTLDPRVVFSCFDQLFHWVIHLLQANISPHTNQKTCVFLKNIILGDRQLATAIYEHGVVPLLIHLLQHQINLAPVVDSALSALTMILLFCVNSRVDVTHQFISLLKDIHAKYIHNSFEVMRQWASCTATICFDPNLRQLCQQEQFPLLITSLFENYSHNRHVLFYAASLVGAIGPTPLNDSIRLHVANIPKVFGYDNIELMENICSAVATLALPTPSDQRKTAYILGHHLIVILRAALPRVTTIEWALFACLNIVRDSQAAGHMRDLLLKQRKPSILFQILQQYPRHKSIQKLLNSLHQIFNQLFIYQQNTLQTIIVSSFLKQTTNQSWNLFLRLHRLRDPRILLIIHYFSFDNNPL